jgi:tape measure domain-containing protein
VAVANIAIEVNGQQAANALKQITTASRQLESAVGNTTAKVNSQNAVIGSASNQLKTYTRSTQAATGATKSLTSAILPLLVGLKAIEAAQFVFTKTAELESQTKSLEVLTGSVTKAKAIIQELQQLGAVTPFTSTELIDSAKRLNAFGVEGDKVVETTRRLADVAGATGAELQGLVTAYGQVQAKGRLQGEELLQFQERGIALQEELRKMYGLSGEEFQKALSKGRIGAEAVEVAIKRLTDAGGKYANGAIAQSNTLQGKFSTLTDGVESLARNIGTVLAPTIKNVLNLAIMGINAINTLMASGRSAAFSKNLLAAQTKLGAGALGVDPALKDTQNLINQLQGSKQKNLQGAKADLQTIADIRKTLQSVRQREMTFNLSKIGRETIGRQFQQLRSLETAANAAVRAAQAKQQPTGSNDIPALLGESGGGTKKKGKSDAERAAEKAAKEAARLREETQKQLDSASRLSDLAEANLEIQVSSNNEERLKSEFDKASIERRMRFIDLQKQAKSEQERELLASAQLSEILIANNQYAKDRKTLLEQQLKPLQDIITANKTKLEDDKAYQRLIAEGINPELAQQYVEIDRAGKALQKSLEPAVALAKAAVLEAEARGMSAEKIAELKKSLEDLQKLPGQKVDEAKKGAEAANQPKSEAEKVAERIATLKKEITGLTSISTMAITAADGIGAAFANSFQSLIQGSMNAQQALGNFFKSVANMFLEMAAQIIAEQMAMIVLQGILKALGAISGAAGGGSGGDLAKVNMVDVNKYSTTPAMPFANGGVFGSPTFFKFADGGTMQNGVLGEAGPEAIMPLSRGAGGKLGVNASGLREAMGNAPGMGGAPMLNMTFETTRFGNTEYVSRDQLEAAMAQTRRQAANDGAKRGMGMTLDKLQQSPQTRSRVGIR